MEPVWYLLQLCKPLLAIAFGMCFPKCFIPLSNGMKYSDQKLINRGSIYLMISIASLILLISIFWKVG